MLEIPTDGIAHLIEVRGGFGEEHGRGAGRRWGRWCGLRAWSRRDALSGLLHLQQFVGQLTTQVVQALPVQPLARILRQGRPQGMGWGVDVRLLIELDAQQVVKGCRPARVLHRIQTDQEDTPCGTTSVLHCVQEQG